MVVGGNQVVRVGPGGPGMVQGQHVPRDSGCSDGLMIGLHILWSGVHHQAPPHGVSALKGDHTVVDVSHQRPSLQEAKLMHDGNAFALLEVRQILDVAPLCGTTTTMSSSRTPGPLSTVPCRPYVVAGRRRLNSLTRTASLLT